MAGDITTAQLALSGLLGLATGVMSALVFAVLLTFIRPRIEISDVIARGTSQGEPAYKIKVRNQRRRKVIDVEAELYVASVVWHPHGNAEVTTAVPLKRSSLLELGARTKNDHGSIPEHVWRFITFDDSLMSQLAQDERNYLKFVISGRDHFSGKTRSFSMRLRHIENGEFIQGESFEVQLN